MPDWVPGTGFKRTAARWRKTVTELIEKPFEFVKQQMSKGTNETSYVSKLLEKGNLSADDDFVVKMTAASLYSGGADTVRTRLAFFFYPLYLLIFERPFPYLLR